MKTGNTYENVRGENDEYFCRPYDPVHRHNAGFRHGVFHEEKSESQCTEDAFGFCGRGYGRGVRVVAADPCY